MEQQDYELLSQYLDGELPAAAAQALEQRLATEPRLQASLEQLQDLDASLKRAFERPDIERVPASVTALLQRPRAEVVALPRRRSANWGFALAASLVVAVSALLVPRWQQDSTPAGHSMDSALAQVLEQAPSRGEGWDALGDGRQARAVLSFRSSSGQWCREFLLSAQDGDWRGVACRADAGWVNQVVVSHELAGSADQYRPASAAESDQVAAFISAHASDIALDAQREAALIANQWQ